MKIDMITDIKRTVVMIIGDIKMIGTITEKMTERIKDRTRITGIFLRKETPITDNHITVIVIPMRENIISTVVFISITISQKDHDTFNTTIVTEVIKMCRIRLQRNMSKEKLSVRRYRIAIYAGRMGIMQINFRQKIKARHQRFTWYHLPFNNTYNSNIYTYTYNNIV